MQVKLFGVSGVQILDNAGAVVYAEMVADFLNDLGGSFSFTLTPGVAQTRYWNGDGDASRAQVELLDDKGNVLGVMPGLWKSGEDLIAGLGALTAARDARKNARPVTIKLDALAASMEITQAAPVATAPGVKLV